jgi:hypothetical protein
MHLASMALLHSDLHEALKSMLNRDAEMSLKNKPSPPKPARVKQAEFISTLSISDPAGNVIHDLSACVLLEERLINKKLSVATVQALYDNALQRHSELKTILGSVSKGKYMKYAFSKFRNLFQSLFRPSKRTSAMISVLAVSNVSKSTAINTKSAVKVAASTKYQDLPSIAAAATSGTIPVVESATKTLMLTQLKGMVQLQIYTDAEQVELHWAALETFIVNVVCFVKFEKQELTSAKEALKKFQANQAEDKDETLAEYEDLFDACTNWFGAPIENDHSKIQRFISRCPANVRTEYANELAVEKSVVQNVPKTSGAAQQDPMDQNNQRSDARKAPAPQPWITVAKATKKHPHRDPGPRDGVLGKKSQVPQAGSGSQIPLWAANQAPTGDEAENTTHSSRKGSHISGRSGGTSRGAIGVNNSQTSGDIPAVSKAPAPIRRVKREITAVDEAFF